MFCLWQGVWCIICVKYVCHVCRAYCVALVFCMVVSCGMQCDITTLLWHIIHVVCGVVCVLYMQSVLCVLWWGAFGVVFLCCGGVGLCFVCH